jgi:hypothetical protein
MSMCSSKPQWHRVKHQGCHQQPRREQRSKHGSHGTVKNHVHSSINGGLRRALSRPPRGNAGSSRNSKHDRRSAMAARGRWWPRLFLEREFVLCKCVPSIASYFTRLYPVGLALCSVHWVRSSACCVLGVPRVALFCKIVFSYLETNILLCTKKFLDNKRILAVPCTVRRCKWK